MSQLPGLLTLSGVLYGTISAPAPLTGSIVAKASLTATLSTPAGLYGSISPQGQLTGTMIAREPLSGIIVSGGQLVGHISGTIKADDTETYMLVYEDGTEVPAVFVEDEVTFTATENDIRAGSVAATAKGVVTGTKEIPSYNTSEGVKAVPVGSVFKVYIPNYDYTKLQAIFCMFNTSLTDSVSADRVVINDNVYPVESIVSEASVSVNDVDGINFGVMNNSTRPYLIRYFSYKEIY